MFRALDKKMKVILLSVILLYVVLSSVLVFRTIQNRSAEMQRQLSLQYTGQQHKNAQLFMKWMEEVASLVTNNTVVHASLSSSEYDNTIPPILDGMISSNLYISDMVIYGNSGSVYASSNVSAIRPFSEIKEVAEYAKFLSSELTSEWIIQAPGSLVYTNTDPRRRLLYVAKIMDKKEKSAGLLLMTVDLKKMTGFYHADDPELYGRHPTYILTHDHSIVNASGLQQEPDDPIWATLLDSQPGQEMTVNRTDKGIVLLYRLYHSDDRMAILISGEPIKSELRLLRNTLIGVGLFILLLFFVLIQRLSRSILEPLKELYKKMRRHHEI
ncbi:cache domain-containing protein [Cohnella silvisoli]|uniref:Cache domain-containing protein n=1 Tax=Cohnella silvisoli TaxID=2873699 RepID=A0ABV1L354_9BACL|nr:cache domain-containing protein [Cohnella silvisoli]MCD9026097.1 cache domain-containing protein [Cohnella silvisoli]